MHIKYNSTKQYKYVKRQWCPRKDLNFHGFLHKYLKLARLPFRHPGTVTLYHKVTNTNSLCLLYMYYM